MYNQFAQVTFLCPMRFERYPLDEHICKFRVGSTNMDINYMRFGKATIKYDDTSKNTILDYKIEVMEMKDEDRIIAYSGTNYSVTGLEMKLVRNRQKYLYIYFLPSGLFVVVSWVGFLIPPEVVPGRMALLITLFLVLINIFNTVTSNSPNVEGMTAIAAWMLACILFVFGALLAYAFILWRKKKSFLLYFLLRKGSGTRLTARLRKRGEKLPQTEPDTNKFRQEDFSSKVDDVFLVVFPLMFLVFNFIYWPLSVQSLM